MKIYDVGRWIEVTYWDGEVKYFKTLPSNLVGIYLVQYFYSGKLHRENGPAFIEYYEDGSVEIEKYYLNGKLHRKDGPAYIEYRESGRIRTEAFHLHNKFLTEEEWKKQIENL